MRERPIASQTLRFMLRVVCLAVLRTIVISTLLSVEYLPIIIPGFDRNLVGYIGITLGAVATSLSSFFLLWLMLGEANLIVRILVCVLIDISAVHLAVSVTRDLAVLDSGATQHLVSFDTAVIYRVGMLAFYGGMGILLKSLSSARMMGFSIPSSVYPGRHSTSLGHLMLMTVLFAVCFASLRIVNHRVQGSDLWSLLTVLALAELVPLFVITLPAMLVTIGWKNRRAALAVQMAWSIGLLAIILIPVLVFVPAARSDMRQMAAFCGTIVFYQILLAVMLTWAKRHGVVMLSVSDRESPPILQTKIRRGGLVWPSTLLLAVVLATAGAGHLAAIQHHAAVLLTAPFPQSWNASRVIRRLQRVVTDCPMTCDASSASYVTYNWTDLPQTEIAINCHSQTFELTTQIELAPSLIQGLLPKRGVVQMLSISPFLSEHRAALDRVEKIESLYLASRRIDAADLDWLADHIKLGSILVECDSIDQQHIHALKRLSENGTVIRLTLRVPLTPDVRRQLADIKIEAIRLPVTSTDDTALADIAHIENISIVDSEVTATQIENFVKNASVFSLRFLDCNLGRDCIDSLARLNAKFCALFVQWDNVTESDLLRLAQNPHPCFYTFPESPRAFTPIIKEKLNYQARRHACSLGPRMAIANYKRHPNLAFYAVPYRRTEPEDWLELFMEQEGELPDALRPLAHSMTTDANGDITELNLDQMRITSAGATRLAELPRLKQLRLSHDLQDDALWEAISGIDSLTRLEIPAYGLTDEAMESLSKLTQLRHLQLPLPHYTTWINQYHPEEMVFISSCEEAEFLSRLGDSMSRHSERSNSGTPAGWTSASINQLGKLTQLEYLFLPGWLLADDNLDTICGLPNLKALHAPFSELRAEQIQRFCKMPQLRELTIGIAAGDASAQEALGGLLQLKQLRLVMISPELATDSALQAKFSRAIQQSLSECALSVHFLDWPLGVRHRSEPPRRR